MFLQKQITYKFQIAVWCFVILVVSLKSQKKNTTPLKQNHKTLSTVILKFKNNKFYILFTIAILFQSCNQQTTSSCANISTPNISCAPVLDTFTDNRDGRVYQTVTICNQTWMAENLQYDVPNGLTYTYTQYDTFIRQAIDTIVDGKKCYNYEAAIQVCPNGWHLPSEFEWQTLELNLGLNPLDTIIGDAFANHKHFKGCGIVPLLMSTNGWNGRGTNASGFNLIGPDYEILFTSHCNEYSLVASNLGIEVLLKQYFNTSDYIRTRVYIEPLVGCRCVKD